MVRKLTDEQLARIRRVRREWQQYPPPCGIHHEHVYNPCLPEYDDDGWLFCCTCGMRCRPQIGTP